MKIKDISTQIVEAKPEVDSIAETTSLVLDQSKAVMEGVTLEPKPTETRASLLENTKFKAVLSIYSTKNNVFFVLTDVTLKNIFLKRSGGMQCKRGTDKNSQKVALKNLDQVINAIENLKIDFLLLRLRSGVRNKKHSVTNKAVEKLCTTLKIKSCVIYDSIINSTKVAISTVRMKGGRRGRRT